LSSTNRKLILQDFCKEVIKEIDNTEVYNENIIDSPFFGITSIEYISGGASTLIQLYASKGKKFIYLSNMGDNCSKYLYKLSTMFDLHVIFDYWMSFEDLRLNSEFKAYCPETGEYINTYGEYLKCAGDWSDKIYEDAIKRVHLYDTEELDGLDDEDEMLNVSSYIRGYIPGYDNGHGGWVNVVSGKDCYTED